MTGKEYVYEVGMTPNDKERLDKMTGVHTLSLEDYGHAKEVVNSLDIDDDQDDEPAEPVIE